MRSHSYCTLSPPVTASRHAGARRRSISRLTSQIGVIVPVTHRVRYPQTRNGIKSSWSAAHSAAGTCIVAHPTLHKDKGRDDKDYQRHGYLVYCTRKLSSISTLALAYHHKIPSPYHRHHVLSMKLCAHRKQKLEYPCSTYIST